MKFSYTIYVGWATWTVFGRKNGANGKGKMMKFSLRKKVTAILSSLVCHIEDILGLTKMVWFFDLTKHRLLTLETVNTYFGVSSELFHEYETITKDILLSLMEISFHFSLFYFSVYIYVKNVSRLCTHFWVILHVIADDAYAILKSCSLSSILV